MNTLHLRYAIEVAKTKSISQASANLYMAQPNLSKAIHELEASVGIKIFERSSKGVVPTAKGFEFLKYAKNVLDDIEKMKSLKDSENIQETNISIPRGSYIAKAFADLVADLDEKKEINIHYCETNSKETIMNVAEENYDIGVARYQTVNETYFMDYIKEKGLDVHPVLTFKCVVVMSKSHPLARRKTVKYEDLVETSIELVHGDNVIPYTAKSASGLGLNNKRRIFVYERGSQFELLSQVTNSYMWASPVPGDTLSAFGLVQKTCDVPNNEFKDVLIFKKGHELTELEKKFLEKLKLERDIVLKHISEGGK
jgi:DNA-binding transcriptional LysR family regulator